MHGNVCNVTSFFACIPENKRGILYDTDHSLISSFEMCSIKTKSVRAVLHRL